MIHIVFQAADVAVMEKVAALDASLQGDIVEIKDDYAVGPLTNLMEAEGWQARREWWRELLIASPYGDTTDMVNDRMALHHLKKALDEDEKQEAWLWIGQNAHDVCSYYWLISQLKEYAGRVVVLYLNNLPFINEKGHIFYPTTLHQIMPSEFLKAKKLARKVTLSEFEIDPDEWNRLSAENAVVRLLEGGKKITGAGADFYDNDILNNLSREPQKGNRAMYNILSKMKIKTGDVFLLWRMKALAEGESWK